MASDDQLKEAFRLFDKDKDGLISKDELTDILRSLGRNADPSDVRELMNSQSSGQFTARDGKIDFDFFCTLVRSRGQMHEDAEGELKDAFRVLDRVGQGFIGTMEMQKICAVLGEDLTEEEVHNMISEAISNYEGKIYYDGLVKTMISR
jgi:calmodulin